MARPTSRAAASLTAPTTWISTSLDAPSPSATIARASVRATCSTAASNSFHTAPSRAGSTPDAPLASSSAVSFVLVSPSTEMALKLRSATRRSRGCNAPGSATASVVRTASNVAMSGWIIPAPLAIPPTVTMPAAVSRRTAQCFGRVSVVMMARAASTPPRGVRRVAASRSAAAICATGRGTPITPVESTSAVRGGRAAACSAAWATVRAAASPSGPVHAFATRAFIATARIRPGRSESRSASYTTGAARTAFLVNTPAVAQLVREEYLGARRAFVQAIGLDPGHEDALAGLGEVLLMFGDRAGAVAGFDRILALGFRDDHDLMLQVVRALFREAVLDQARRFFEVALTAHPDSAEAAACVGYAAHRLSDEADALYWLRRALELDADQGEARIYLANLLYDRGEYEAALFHLERTEPEDHFDGLAIWRLIELKK